MTFSRNSNEGRIRMDWNEWNRNLQNRIGDPGTRYMLGLVYERVLDLAKQVDENNTILIQMANSMQAFVGLNEEFERRLQYLKRHVEGRTDGVSVESVPLTNDDLN